jgi:hypothetical protein
MELRRQAARLGVAGDGQEQRAAMVKLAWEDRRASGRGEQETQESQ